MKLVPACLRSINDDCAERQRCYGGQPNHQEETEQAGGVDLSHNLGIGVLTRAV